MQRREVVAPREDAQVAELVKRVEAFQIYVSLPEFIVFNKTKHAPLIDNDSGISNHC